jgi:hypothetical protein
MTKRKVKDARKAEDGTIEAVLLEGNKNYTGGNKAYEMAKNGQIDLVAVGTGEGKHVRTRPDKKKTNNLSDMADD